MDVGVVVSVVLGLCLDDDIRVLRRGTIVQIGQWPTVNVLVQRRKIGAQARYFGVAEGQGDINGSVHGSTRAASHSRNSGQGQRAITSWAKACVSRRRASASATPRERR